MPSGTSRPLHRAVVVRFARHRHRWLYVWCIYDTQTGVILHCSADHFLALDEAWDAGTSALTQLANVDAGERGKPSLHASTIADGPGQAIQAYDGYHVADTEVVE
jgi:hypothetical protein